MKNKPTRTDKVNLGLKILMAVMFIIGFLIFMYPFVVDAVNNYVDQQRLTQVEQKMAKQSEKERKARIEELRKKNAENKTNIPGAGDFEDPFEHALRGTKSPKKEYYEEHTVGAIFIPKINVSLPIYDLTNDILLDKGATILQGTSFPIGGKNTHSVVTGHTGLPDKKLFTDLVELKKKDTFYLHIEGEKLAYRVEKIKTVKPNELDDLKIIPGKDLVTLLTCTPYGINSHRLLVTGHRTAYPKEAAEKEIKKAQSYHRWRVVLLIICCIFFLGCFFYFVWRKTVLYQSKKRNFDLVFYLLENGQPVAGVPFQLTTRRGKDPVYIDGELQNTVSDSEGRILFENIPGDIYHLISENEVPKIKGKVWKLSDKQFKIITQRKYLIKEKVEKQMIYQVDRKGKKHG
ncbi:hypothetical protein NRIC_19210 [Enterococcus florum]|uniref:Class C sortase n=1 Tax=Enterococcus florum TaxID=2480627 RepID=A0A4P5P869_9ENTE|nr:class C sortase [Enterococcus florum]GCF94030.1 hypothetical protein NRIC_19210 [Enterococcus florum]